jgi:hypothetical protein
VTNSGSRKVLGQLKRIKNSLTSFSPMANVVGGLSLSSQDSDDAARVAGFVGLIIFALT